MNRDWYERSFGEDGLTVTGLDLSEAPLARARECDAGGEYERIRVDRRSKPFGDRSYEVTVEGFASFCCFFDPGDKSKSLKENPRGLKPGGKFLVREMRKQAGLVLAQVRGGCDGSRCSRCEASSSARLILLGRRAG